MKSIHRTTTLLGLALLAAIAVLAPPAARAQINYQGTLTDSNGANLADGQYTLTFSLWDSALGTALAGKLWGDYVADGGSGTGHGAQAALVNGRFNIIIGGISTTIISGNTSLTTALAAPTAYLEIKVGTAAAISPRQQILATPRALRADVIPNVTPNGAGVVIAGAIAASGNVTATDVTASGNITAAGNATVNGNVGIGTTTPAAKLDVNGDILSHSKSVPIAEEKLRMVRGTINADGTVQLGSGFTSTRNSLGTFAITFPTAFSNTPSVTTQIVTAAGFSFTRVSAASVTAFTLQIITTQGGLEDQPFSFIAVGPR